MRNYKTRICKRVAPCLTAAKAKKNLTSGAANFKKYGKAAFPALAFTGVNLIFSQAANAQGPIFSGDAGNLSNIIREGLKLMAILLFCLGAVGVAWGIFNKMTGKEWGSQIFGSILAFAFGTVVAVFWQIAQGRSVSVDTNF